MAGLVTISAAADFTSLTSNIKFPFSSYFVRAEANVQTRFTSWETAYARPFYIIKNELTVVTRSWLRSTVLFCSGSGGLLLAGKTGSYVVWCSPMVTSLLTALAALNTGACVLCTTYCLLCTLSLFISNNTLFNNTSRIPLCPCLGN